jgi:hypothetical protein
MLQLQQLKHQKHDTRQVMRIYEDKRDCLIGYGWDVMHLLAMLSGVCDGFCIFVGVFIYQQSRKANLSH